MALSRLRRIDVVNCFLILFILGGYSSVAFSTDYKIISESNDAVIMVDLDSISGGSDIVIIFSWIERWKYPRDFGLSSLATMRAITSFISCDNKKTAGVLQERYLKQTKEGFESLKLFIYADEDIFKGKKVVYDVGSPGYIVNSYICDRAKIMEK